MATRKTASRNKRQTVVSTSSKRSFALSNFKLKNLILPAVVIIVVLLLGFFKDQFIVATVNGKQISRIELIRQLEKKDGKAVLESMVTEQLILQEAHLRKVNVPEGEINTEISNIEKNVTLQGENLDVLLAQQNMTRNDLISQVKIQLLLKKMVGGNITVSEKEINDYMEQNKDSIPESTDPASLKPQIKTQLEQQKLNEKIQSLVADLQKKGKVEYLLK